jgi:hypothetical protein
VNQNVNEGSWRSKKGERRMKTVRERGEVLAQTERGERLFITSFHDWNSEKEIHKKTANIVRKEVMGSAKCEIFIRIELARKETIRIDTCDWF